MRHRLACRPLPALLLSLTLLLTACGGKPTAPAAGQQPTVADPNSASSTAPKNPLEKVRVGVWSSPLSEEATLFAADAQGFFKNQGISYEFVPGQGGGDALKQLVAGNVQFAFTNLEPVFFAVEQGAKLKVIYNIYPQNVFNVVALKGKGITRIADLKGKKVGVYSQASGTRYNLMVMLRSAGLKESDVQVVPVGIGNFAALLKGDVDAMAATDTGLWDARQKGLGDVDVLWARDVLGTPSDAFVVTEEFYNTHKDLIKRFVGAYRQAAQWTLDNPQQAAEIAKTYAADGKDVARNLEMVKIRNVSTVSDGTKAHGLGWFDLDVLKQVETAFRDLGLTKQPIDMEKLFTNEFIAK